MAEINLPMSAMQKGDSLTLPATVDDDGDAGAVTPEVPAFTITVYDDILYEKDGPGLTLDVQEDALLTSNGDLSDGNGETTTPAQTTEATLVTA